MMTTEHYFDRLVKGPPFSAGEEMKFELARLATYDSWPHWARIRPTKLAPAGFFYTGSGDTVTCFSCKGDIGQWQAGRDPAEEHHKLYPSCKYLKGEDDDNVAIAKVPDPVMPAEDAEDSHDASAEATSDIIASTHRIKYGLSQIYDLLPGVRQKEEELASDAGSESMSLTESMASLNFGETRLPTNTTAPVAAHTNTSQSIERMNMEMNRRTFSSSPALETLGRVSNVDQQQLKMESYRLRSFQNGWPETAFVGPPELAKNGFYYLGNLDRVKCAYCNGVLRNWRPDDRPEEEHKRHFSHCPFVRGLDVGNISLEQEAQGIQIAAANRNRQPNPSMLGVLTERPNHPEYAIEAARVATFRNWPKTDVQSPEILARAGFFYVGYSDNCKCFFCDGGLRNWEAPDCPWVEHARWFPQCGFLKMCKGEEYIHQIQVEYGMIDEPALPPPPPRQENPVLPGVQYRIDPREIRARMDTPTVRAVRQMEFPEEVIKRVIDHRLRSSGDDFPNAEALIQAIFDLQESDRAEAHDTGARATSPSTGAEEHKLESATPEPSKKAKKKRNRNKKKKGTNKAAESEDRKEATPEPSGASTPFGWNDVRATVESGATVEGGDDSEGEVEDEDDPKSLFEENQRMKEQRVCKICMDAEVNIVFLPCGHLVCCGNCAPALRQCPICRQTVRGTVRVFLS